MGLAAGCGDGRDQVRLDAASLQVAASTARCGRAGTECARGCASEQGEWMDRHIKDMGMVSARVRRVNTGTVEQSRVGHGARRGYGLVSVWVGSVTDRSRMDKGLDRGAATPSSTQCVISRIAFECST
ncbi:MAG: hypothetical protein EA398_15690 [Deltaproteobacteria bacterium]|nr:MAG: hypothetical protein EA398_15690 [Deltaproteobacteria bacterium]